MEYTETIILSPTDNTDFSDIFLLLLFDFYQDFVHTRHNSNKFDFCPRL